MKLSRTLALGLCLLTQMESLAAAETGASEPTANPLALVKMVEFSGPQAEGFHDCFWIGPVSYHAYNIAYPDEGAVYWGTSFQLQENASHLEIEGAYPNARYMSYNAYDKLTQPSDALLDVDIVASEGANPFSSDDKRGGRYRIRVMPGEAPSERPANTIYLGAADERNTRLPLVLRHYVPAAGTDFTGGAGLPSVTLVMKDGKRLTREAMCEAINSPRPGSAERSFPSVAMEPEVYRGLVTGPEVPRGFPARERPEWIKFWGGDVSISRYLADRAYLEQAMTDAAAGTRTKRSGFYANTHNDYIGAYVNETFGEVVVLKGKLPTTPTQGWDVTGDEYQLRYWSLCTNESIPTTRYADCVFDHNVAIDDERQYTIVVSKVAHRPANATRECGVTWLDWGELGDGAGDPTQGHLILRNMLGEGFAHSVQNVSSISSAEEDMGPYFPATGYTTKADFEARGCNSDEA